MLLSYVIYNGTRGIYRKKKKRLSQLYSSYLIIIIAWLIDQNWLMNTHSLNKCTGIRAKEWHRLATNLPFYVSIVFHFQVYSRTGKWTFLEPLFFSFSPLCDSFLSLKFFSSRIYHNVDYIFFRTNRTREYSMSIINYLMRTIKTITRDIDFEFELIKM